MVLQANRERRILQRIAPHLVGRFRSCFRSIEATGYHGGDWQPE